MGVATFLIAFVPTYDSIGIWGAIILTLLRICQGIGVGGQWGGSVLLAMEWSRHHGQRGLVASWPQLGVPCGLFLSNLAVLGFSAWSGDQFDSWGWRIPFALSILLVGFGLWMRFGIFETPVFQELADKGRIVEAPIVELVETHPLEIVLSALLRMAEQAPFYIFTAFIFAYATGTLHMQRNFILFAVLVASALSFVTIPLSGYVSDRIGRRKMYLIGAGTVGLFGFLYFGMVDTAIPSAVFIAIVLSLIPHDLQYGPQAALIAEAFTPRLRYSGASLGYQLASVIAGGPAPLIATALLATYHTGYAIAIYIAACAVVSLIAAAFMPDYTGKDISKEYDGLMRSYESLRPDDFPGVNPRDFVQWQKAIVSANKRMGWWLLFQGAVIIVFVSITILAFIGGDYILFGPLVVLGVILHGVILKIGYYLCYRKSGAIALRISITKDMVKEARSRV
jgi:MFS family permease